MEKQQLSQINDQQPLSVQTRKSNSFLVTLLSISLLVFVFIAGFFAWKTQKLVKEITSLRVIPTTQPVASPTPDPTVDWKTYENEKYSFRYPNGWVTSATQTGESDRIITFSNTINKFDLGKQIDKIELNQTLKEYFLDHQLGEMEIIDESQYKFGEITALRLVLPLINGDLSWKYGIYYTFLDNSDIYFLEYYTNDYDTDIKISDQILSTFKFTDSSSVACPEDARTCPDGSSVVRIGPKCEFAQCPATSPRP